MEKIVTRIMEIDHQALNNGFCVVYTRWKNHTDFKWSIIKSDDLHLFMETTETVSTDHYKYSNIFTYDNEILHTGIPVVFVGDHYQDLFHEKSSRWKPSKFNEVPPDQHEVVLISTSDYLVFDTNGNLLNDRINYFVTEEDYNLSDLIKHSKTVDWLEILPGSGFDPSEPIYYVHGNGEQMNIRVHITPEEYLMYITSFNHSFNRIIKYKLEQND